MDISMLRDRSAPRTFTVTELNDYIKNIFDKDRTLNAISVKGEISNFTNHRSGHLYFTLKDESSQIKAVMFRSSAQKLKFIPENGMRVIVFGYISVYQRDGVFQMYANTMQPDGVGALYLAYEQLKEKLSAEGLFDDIYPQQVPQYPAKIGVITSPTGAAVRNIITVTKRSFPLAKLFIYPSLVQGEGAEDNLVKALEYFDEAKVVDVIIIGRGGGSIEDLWAFNSEKLARKIFEAQIPIISAVGHETDFTICDFVSDLRAPTPSAAAELSVPDSDSILLRLDDISERLGETLVRYIERKKEALSSLENNRALKAPDAFFEGYRDKLSSLRDSLKNGIGALLEVKKFSFVLNSEKLSALNPLSVISRGYAMVQREDEIVKNAKQLAAGDRIEIIISGGTVNADVIEVTKQKGSE